MEQKTCSKCGLQKEKKEFTKGTRFKDGLQPWCRECVKGYSKEEKHREQCRTLKRKRRENPEYRRRECEGQKARCDANLPKYLLELARRRAKDFALPFNLGITDIVIPEACPVLKKPMLRRTRYAPTVDRIVPELGYVKGNVVVISYRANAMKNDATQEDLANFCQYYLK